MSLSKKQKKAKNSAEQTPDSPAIDRDPQGRRAGFIIAATVIALILAIVGFFSYQEYVAPFQRTIITVDGIDISMGYFLQRAKLSGTDPMSMLDTLAQEQIIKLAAPQYGIEVTPEDIDREIRRVARGESETITDSEFKEWYRQLRNETGLSDSDYRELVTTGLLATRLHAYLAERMPTIAEQVHLHAIILETYENAEKIRERWEAGEDFADLAREASLHTESGELGGDLGWWPRGVDPLFDYAFDLSINEVSEPLSDEEVFYLFMVSEKADVRELSEDSLQILQAKVLEAWLLNERQFHEVSYNFNSEIYAWIGWQLAKE